MIIVATKNKKKTHKLYNLYTYMQSHKYMENGEMGYCDICGISKGSCHASVSDLNVATTAIIIIIITNNMMNREAF